MCRCYWKGRIPGSFSKSPSLQVLQQFIKLMQDSYLYSYPFCLFSNSMAVVIPIIIDLVREALIQMVFLQLGMCQNITREESSWKGNGDFFTAVFLVEICFEFCWHFCRKEWEEWKKEKSGLFWQMPEGVSAKRHFSFLLWKEEIAAWRMGWCGGGGGETWGSWLPS